MGNNSNYIENQGIATNQPQKPSNPQSPKQNIQNLVETGQLNEALRQLKDLLPEYQQSAVILLRGRLIQLGRNEITGNISNSEVNTERNRIMSAILSLLDDLN